MSDTHLLITENIDVWTTAIKKRSSQGRGSNKKIELTGIKKLRELIFELAVRGKLVSQESCDEPASELLERLTNKKSLIAKSGKFSELKTKEALKLDGLFEIPSTWKWCHLNDIAAIARGGSPRPIKSFITDSEDGLNWIKIGDSTRGSRYITETEQKIIKEGLVKTRQVYPGDLILSNSMSFGFPYILKISGCIHDGWLLLRTPENDLNKIFLCNLFMSTYAKKAFTNAASGAVVQNLNADKVKLLAIPLPPLAEQHRIVAKVDELMALCDQLEQQTEDSITAHQTLVETLLATLSNSESPAAFNQNWTRIAEHFDTLFTTEHSIDQLKQTVLQLAVMGKLVPQAPSDEPASELLERLTEKKSLIAKAGKFSELNTKNALKLDHLFEIPSSWKWCHLDDIAAIARGGSPRPIKSFITDSEDGLNWIKIGDSTRGSRYITETEQKIIKEGLVKTRQVYPGDLILSNSMSFGFPYILKITGCIHDGWLVLRTPEDDLNKIFLCNLFMSTYAKNAFSDAASGAVVQNLNADKVKLLAIPLPPLEEQHRIVKKVDELLTLCDQLKSRLSEAQTTQLHLANTLVKQALN